MKCPNCQCAIPDTARKCPICSALSKVKGKPVPGSSVPVEKLLLLGGLGLGAALLLWGAALLMRPAVHAVVAPPVAAPAPPPPQADVVTEAPEFPAMNFPPPAPEPVKAPAVVPKLVPPLPRPIRGDGTVDDTIEQPLFPRAPTPK